jgi:hypothetical protein
MSLILSGTDGLSDVDGSASTPAIRGTDTNTGIFFPAADTIAFAEGGAEVARFNSSGNLGIGITTPNTELHVQGAPTTDGSIVFNEQLTATTAFNALPQSGTMVSLKYNTGGDYAGLGGWSVIKENATDGNFAGAMLFHSRANGGAITERMRIDSSGRVGVGATSLSNKFTVVDSNDIIRVQTSQTGAVNAGMLLFYDGAGDFCGQITSNPSTNTTSYNTSSDYRLKNTITPMVGALEKVKELKPCTWFWKSAPETLGQGFIAHELAEVCPDAVVGEKDAVETYFDENGVEQTRPKYQMIDTSFLVATLTAAIQELKAELDGVKAELATLKA